MCGICGYIGNLPKEALHEMMLQTDTRGGHAFGLAWQADNGKHKYFKKAGEYTGSGIKLPDSHLVIGHTRFATHGSPEDNANNHPHIGGGLALVHNGVVRNKHKNQRTQCDSEAILKMLLDEPTRTPAETQSSLAHVAEQIKGSFRIALINSKTPGYLYLACDHADPVFIGLSAEYMAFASEAEAIPAGSALMRSEGGRVYAISPDRNITEELFEVAEEYDFLDWKDYRTQTTTPQVIPRAPEPCDFCTKDSCEGCRDFPGSEVLRWM